MLLLLITSGRVSIISFSSFVGAPVGMESGSFALFFSLTTGIIKKLLSTTRKKKKGKSMIRFLCWLKVNSIVLKL